MDFTQTELAKYSVVLLGDLPPSVLTTADWQALHDFVDRGGALVLLGGANSLARSLRASPFCACPIE